MFQSMRGFLLVLVAIVLSMMFGSVAKAQHVRHDARSAEGQKMLKIYAKAVAKMKATKAADPDSWTFQWYTHAVRSDKTKAGEIMAIYGAGSSPTKMLAQSMWDTCQPHTPPGSSDDFLPWHRMYVYYFEEIIRDVSGDKSFTLPYWNYSVTNPTIHGVIPPEFTKKNDPLYKSLYIENRNAGVNAGQAIDKGQPPSLLSTDALAECFYDPTGGTHPGFCMKLNGGLHGNVHGLVGDGMNMGSVPWAANDPIFWLHHCNIDRLWASWNAAGRSNPAGSGSFTFAEKKKKKVVANIHDWMDPKTEKHGYCYDKLESVPKCATTKPAVVAKIQSSLKVAAMKEKEIKLGAAPVKVPLGLLTVKKNEKPLAFHERIKALPNNKHVYLIVKNLHADATPGVLYHLYLELPEGVKGDKALPHYVGTVNFFDAVKHGDAGHEMKKGPGMFFRFDITDVARGLHAKNLLQASPTLTIAPAGQPADKANAVIGEISIVEE